MLFLLAAAGAAHAGRLPASDASALLRKANEAERRVAYIGTKLVRYSSGKEQTPRDQEVRVWHAPPDKTRLEVLPPAEIAGLVAVEVGEQRFHYRPWEQQRWITLPRPYKPPLEMLLKNYSVREAGKEMIAGRPARAIQIRSRHPGNRQRNVWIDRQMGIILKSELLDEAGNRLSGWQFREIEFPAAVPAAMFTTPAPPSNAETPHAQSFQRINKPSFTIVELGYLPPGYTEVRRAAYRSWGRDRVMIRFTDGLNVIYFTQEPVRDRNEEGPGTRPFRDPGRSWPGERGPGHRFRREPPPFTEGNVATRLNWIHGSLRLTLLGGVDRAQLEKMKASVAPASPDQSMAKRAGGR